MSALDCRYVEVLAAYADSGASLPDPQAAIISQLQAEIARYREALKPFAADKFPCSRRTKIAYNEWGLRCLMSDMEIARMSARAALGGSNDKPGSGI